MDYVKGFDRWLASPAQYARLRAESADERPLLRTIGVFVLAFLGEIALSLLLSIILGVYAGVTGADPVLLGSGWLGVALNLFATAGMVAVVLLSARKDPGRVGCEPPLLREYPLGALIGLVIFSAAVSFCVLTGALTLDGLSPTFAPLPWLFIFVGFLIQGLSEELLCRGLIMLAVARTWLGKGRKNPVLAGILFNSIIFAALHLSNNGISPLALLNLALFGVFASLYYLWRGNIWGIAALHSLWNFTQGNLFGILVSGGTFGTTLLSSRMTGSPLINGGDFGLEGGLAVTLVLVLGIAFVAWQNVDRIAKTPMPLNDPPELN